MTLKIHPIKTGCVNIKKAQKRRKPGGLVSVILDKEWTGWLPVLCWLIEHPEGLFMVDTGETASSVTQPSYYPKWHPYYRTSVKMKIKPEEEVGEQLKKMGIINKDINKVILTHFHTDHTGGLHHFEGTKVFASEKDYKLAQGISGKLRGYLPHRWPENFNPIPVIFNKEEIGPFKKSYRLTKKGDIFIVPTPGHTPNHQSVIVKSDDKIFFIAGDTSYSQKILLENKADGVSPSELKTLKTINKIRELGKIYPMVYLPSHDPESTNRLADESTLYDKTNESKSVA